MAKLAQKLQEDRFVVSDGAVGTELQRMGLPVGACGEEWCLSRPDLVKGLHRQYAEAGAQIITTNSFSANPIAFAGHGLADDTAKICRRAAEIAREAAPDCVIGGSLGPLGELLEPLGTLSVEEATEAFGVSITALVEGGSDIALFETFSCVNEARAASNAAAKAGVEFVLSFTFEKGGRTIMGASPRQCVELARAVGAIAVGTNCGGGPEQVLSVVREMADTADLPILAQPNAGLPELVGGKPTYKMTAAEFAGFAPKLAQAGARLIGSCCGSTPEFTAAIRKALTHAAC